jgi:hypothetical protein
VRKRKNMSKERKQQRVYELAQWARENKDKWHSMDLWFYLDAFARKWGLARETVRLYLPEVRKLLKHSNAEWQTALSSFEEPS